MARKSNAIRTTVYLSNDGKESRIGLSAFCGVPASRNPGVRHCRPRKHPGLQKDTPTWLIDAWAGNKQRHQNNRPIFNRIVNNV